LTKEKLLDDGINFSGMCSCGKTHECLLVSSIKVIINILLNNYVKHLNDTTQKNKSNAQTKSHTTRKLVTLEK
jgi:hypothetical protein